MARRTEIRNAAGTMYAKRDRQGQFTEMDEKGRSLAADRRTKAKTTVRKGHGDEGDQKKRSTTRSRSGGAATAKKRSATRAKSAGAKRAKTGATRAKKSIASRKQAPAKRK